MNRSFLLSSIFLIGFCVSSSANAVEQIQIAEESSEDSQWSGERKVNTRKTKVKEVFVKDQNRFTVTGGLGAVVYPTVNFQVEMTVTPRSSVVMGIQGGVPLGSGSVAFRPYLTGDASGGLYLEAGVHGGAGVALFCCFVSGLGPHFGLGGKYEARNRFTVDVNVGITALFDIGSVDIEQSVVPIPTASVTFGRRLKKRS